MVESITIVGASLAGIRGAEALRKADFSGPISLIGAEAHLPYDRPPLSKQVLAGDWDIERIQLTTTEKITELDLDVRLSTSAIGFDLASRELQTVGPNGENTELVDGLLIASGARARTLPGTETMVGVHTLRTTDDAAAIAAAVDAGAKRVVVIGAGFIGAEVAATLRGKGVEVVLIESLAYPMARVLGEDIGMLCGDIQTDQGVDLRCGVGVDRLETSGSGNGRGTAPVITVVLTDGSEVETDLVVVGIGVIPNTEWLEGSGLTIDNGVVCDTTCLAAPGVTAAGDIARWHNRRFDEVMRVEHWENAVDQAGFAARRLLSTDDDAVHYEPIPWFWSDQYDRKIQMAGRPRSTDDAMLVTGSMDERRFAVIFGRDDKLTGVFGMNRPRHVMQYRMRIEEGMSWDEALATVDS